MQKMIAPVALVAALGACGPKSPSGGSTAQTPTSSPDLRSVHVCVERTLPEASAAAARRFAEEQNAQNREPPEQPSGIAMPTHRKWANGSKLRVHLLGSDPEVNQKVQNVALEWTKYANIQLVFDNDPKAEIRVAFMQGQGSWSYVGTECAQVPLEQPTMNLGWLDASTPDEEYSRVVLHEFGHALGCIHEHQSPDTGISWNKPVVYEYYGGPPNYWSREKVDFNLFQKYSKSHTNFSRFDPKSIMLYAIDVRFTTDGFHSESNKYLSPTDKCFMEKTYPKPGTTPCAQCPCTAN